MKNVSFTDDRYNARPADTLSKPPAVPFTEQMITTSVMGKILMRRREPNEGATVSAGSKTTTTDEYGIFRLRAVTVPKQSALVMREKTGYLKEHGRSVRKRVETLKKCLGHMEP
jgi:hypothetical protein